MVENLDFGGLTTEEAGIALIETLKQVQKDPYFQLIILPMMEARIRYDESEKNETFKR